MRKMTKAQRQAHIESQRPEAERRYAAENLRPRLQSLIAEQDTLVTERKSWSLANPFDIRPNTARLVEVNTELDRVHQRIHTIQREVYGDC